MTVQVREHQKTPLWRNATVLKWSAQIFVLLVVLVVFVTLAQTATSNFTKSNVSFGWDWLSDPPGIGLREGIDTNPDSGVRALTVGVINTLRVAISGIVVATLLGTLIGIARLSSNWIVNKIAVVYIETIRNIPLLVQIFFWSALAIGLADLTADDVGEYWFKVSNKGFAFAWVFPDGGFWPWLVFVVTGIFVGRWISKRRKAYQERTGNPGHGGRFWALTVLVFAVVGWFAWPILGWLEPVFNWISDLIAGLPPILVPITIAVASVLIAGLWIRNFFESRRTPAGFGKMTDDDWFRVIFVAFSGIAIALLAFVISGFEVKTVAGETLAVAELIVDGFSNFFAWLASKFNTDNYNTVVEGVRSGGPLVFERPEVILKGGAAIPQYGDTGMVVTIPFFSIWTGVTLYTAAFIAEIVRGGILAVPKGQTEASQALGMKRSQLLRLIVLPQAFRIILPPLGNQYLNLFKNTSLGLAVAYADIVAVGTTIINQTGQSLPVVTIWMAFFLTGSLIISSIVNYFNRRMQLVER
ncbi:MAG: ABC transporter permease subunit [Acidimicrobiia bacterium]